MKAQIQRALIAVAAWPLGLVLALLWFLVSSDPSDCVTTQSGGGEYVVATATCTLAPMPWWQFALLLALAFGPGIMATRAYWKGRRSAP